MTLGRFFPFFGAWFIHQLNGWLNQIMSEQLSNLDLEDSKKMSEGTETCTSSGPSSFVLQSIKLWAKKAGPCDSKPRCELSRWNRLRA